MTTAVAGTRWSLYVKERVTRIWGRSHGIRQEKIGRTKRGGRSGGEATEGKTEGEEPPRLVGTTKAGEGPRFRFTYCVKDLFV